MGHKFTIQLMVTVFSSLMIFSGSFAFAQSNHTEFQYESISGDEIKSSSVAKQMLEKIKQSKQILKELQAGKHLEKTSEQLAIDEQRKLSQEILQKQLDRMNKDYEPYTPQNAFATFLGGVNATHHGLYWDQFNYVDSKVKVARAAKQMVLDNGGTYHDALREYVKYASMTRVEMIQFNEELNIKYGFSDSEIQKNFDKFGKLPRYD
ncbi:MAG: hypothetical protein EA446_05100 [Nitrosopumilus sp.]|nr:MAG: hypothetical protein EA446_05100 [Nitrosopumilus sp.]